jgi:glycine cleavage system H protein
MQFPDDLKYTQNDEWIRTEGNQGFVGITDYAQDQLSDVVYVEVFSVVGEQVAQGEAFGVVESVKAAADIYMPVTGTILEINESLAETPELVNTDPYGDAWMVKIEINSPAEMDELMGADGYREYTEEREQ